MRLRQRDQPQQVGVQKLLQSPFGADAKRSIQSHDGETEQDHQSHADPKQDTRAQRR